MKTRKGTKKNKKQKVQMGNGGKGHEWAPIGTNASVMDVWNYEKARKKVQMGNGGKRHEWARI